MLPGGLSVLPQPCDGGLEWQWHHRCGGGLWPKGLALGAAPRPTAADFTWRCGGDAGPKLEVRDGQWRVADFGGVGWAQEEEMYSSHASGWLV